MGYFNVTVKPDIIDGDISKVIASNAADAPFAADDILFDWQAIDVPKGTVRLESVEAYLIGEDGGVQGDKDFSLVFAKSINNTAPTTLGEENAAQTACFELPLHFLGSIKIEATAVSIPGLAFGTAYSWGATGDAGMIGPMILTPEPSSGTNVGYDKLYVAAFAGGAFDFSTGVLANAAVSDDAGTAIVVKTVDPRKAFNVGDTVYIHDVDTAIGTVDSLTDNDIILTSNNVGAIAESDEFMNATPITIQLGFSQ